MKKLITPIVIIITAIILGVSLIFIQVNKSNSIERQQVYKLAQEDARIELKEKKDDCNNMLKGLKEQWVNVIGINYNESWRECEVTYKNMETKALETTALSTIFTANK